MEQTIYLEEKQTERAPTPNPLFSVHADFMANLSFKIAEKVALQDFVQQQVFLSTSGLSRNEVTVC